MNKEYTISRLKRDGFKVESRGKTYSLKELRKTGLPYRLLELILPSTNRFTADGKARQEIKPHKKRSGLHETNSLSQLHHKDTN